MTDSFLENAGGYTPVPDKLVREYGFETAYVWGKVWRYCQMDNGACTASHQTIADRAGMSRRTLIDKLDKLIKDGYIEDLTPNLKNKPHTYCTKKGEEKITSTMQISHTESDTPAETPNPDTSESHLGMRNPHSEDAENAQSDSPTMQNLHIEDAENAQPTMQNLHLKKDSLETLKETKDTDLTPKGVVTRVTRGAGAKTMIRDKFLELTQLEMPGLKTDISFWWSQIGEILKIAKGDVDSAIKIMATVIDYMHAEGLPITSPKSIVGLCRSLATGQGLRRSESRRSKDESIPFTFPEPPDPIPTPIPTPNEAIWKQAQGILKTQMTGATYDTVIKGTRLSRKNGHYVVIAPTEASRQWLEGQLAANVRRAVSTVIGSTAEVEFKLDSG